MNTALEIEHRANVMFAELKGLTLHDGSVESLEQKDMQEGMEEKVRRVRTPAGVRRFKKPIGSIIGRGGKVFQNITIEKPVFDGWDLVKDKKGKKYDVGKEGGKWQAYGHNDWDDLVAEADSEDDLYEALDRRAGGAKKPVPVKKPSAGGPKGTDTSNSPKLSRAEAAEVGRLENNTEKARYLELRKAGETHKRAIARVEGERSGDHTGGLSNERRSKRPVNVRTADDEEREAQSATGDDRAPEDIGRHERVARQRNEPRKPRSRAEARKFFEEHGVTYNDYEVIKRGEKNFGLSGAEADEYDKLTNPEKRRYFALRTDTQGRISQSHTGAMRDLKGGDAPTGRPDDGGETEGRLANLNASQRRAYDALPARAQTMYVAHLAAGGSPASALKTAKETYKKMLERAANDPKYAKRFGLPTSGKAQGVLF